MTQEATQTEAGTPVLSETPEGQSTLAVLLRAASAKDARHVTIPRQVVEDAARLIQEHEGCQPADADTHDPFFVHTPGLILGDWRCFWPVIDQQVLSEPIVYDRVTGFQASCTGVAATHCPVHGDCTCPRHGDGEVDYAEGEAGCPLHAITSLHAQEAP